MGRRQKEIEWVSERTGKRARSRGSETVREDESGWDYLGHWPICFGFLRKMARITLFAFAYM